MKCAGVGERVVGIDGDARIGEVRLTTLASLDARAELFRVAGSYGLLRFFAWPSFTTLRFDGAKASAMTGSIACPNCDQSIWPSGIPLGVDVPCLLAFTVL